MRVSYHPLTGLALAILVSVISTQTATANTSDMSCLLNTQRVDDRVVTSANHTLPLGGKSTHLVLRSDQRAALSSMPDNPKDFFNRAEAHRYLKQYCQAIRDYSEAIDRTKDYAKAHLGRGVAFYELTQYQKAIEDLTASLNRKPDAQAYYYRSLAYLAIRLPSQARNDIELAFQRSSHNPVVQALKQKLAR